MPPSSVTEKNTPGTLSCALLDQQTRLLTMSPQLLQTKSVRRLPLFGLTALSALHFRCSRLHLSRFLGKVVFSSTRVFRFASAVCRSSFLFLCAGHAPCLLRCSCVFSALYLHSYCCSLLLSTLYTSIPCIHVLRPRFYPRIFSLSRSACRCARTFERFI